MTDHNIDNFMKLVTNHKGPTDKESRSDQYYRKQYQKIMAGRVVNWNWAAFAGNTVWMLYRKMYMNAIVLPLCAIMYYLVLLLFIPSKEVFKAYEHLFVGAYILLFLCPFVLSGLFSNWLYVRHIHKKIDKGYHHGELENIDGMSSLLSVFIPFLGVISAAIIAFNDKRKVKRSLLGK